MRPRSREGLYGQWPLLGALASALIALGAGGAYTATTGWQPSAAFILACLIGTIALHIGVAIAGYRQAMRRPWPKVQPLRDDDWD